MTYDLKKIQVKCAEVLGWQHKERQCPHSSSVTEHYWYGPNNDGFKEDAMSCTQTMRPSGDVVGKMVPDGLLPNFPESADAALLLVDWMAKPENGGASFSLNADKKMLHADQGWEAVFLSPTLKTKYGRSNVLPLAICIAFLKANNINLEELQ